jgi:hypothetical protein
MAWLQVFSQMPRMHRRQKPVHADECWNIRLFFEDR